MTTRARVLSTAAGVLLIALIYWLDQLTVSRIGFSLFYVLPVAAAGWFLGLVPSIILAAVATTGWFLADQSYWGWETPAIGAWNAVTRLIIFGSLGVGAARLRLEHAALLEANEQLGQLLDLESRVARTDPKTGLPNSRHLLEQLGREMSRSRREGRPIAILYIDLDDFKSVNDAYGHEGGDRALGLVAAGIKSVTRAFDVSARMGGDEFVVLLWNVDITEATSAASRLLSEIGSVSGDFPEARLGCSIGLVHCIRGEEEPEELIRRADHEMYRAKRSGKNRVSVWSDT